MMIASAPIQSTFKILANPRNRAAIPVLSHGMRSPIPAIRIASIQALVERGGRDDMAAIVECIDRCTDEDLPLLRTHGSLFATPIDAALSNPNPEMRQRGLIAIAKLKVVTHYHHLVQVTASPDDPQQIVASQLLTELASDLGNLARMAVQAKLVTGRRELLDALEGSIANYSQHRMKDVVDCWIMASHWDDEAYLRLFSPIPDSIVPIVFKRIRSLHHPEVLQLLLGSYWSKRIIGGAIDLAIEKIADHFPGDLCHQEKRFGITPVFAKNMKQYPLSCLSKICVSSLDPSSHPYDSVIRLIVASGATPDIVLANVIQALAKPSALIEKECATAIRSIRMTNASIITMVMSDCFDLPDIEPYEPPPWKGNLRNALELALSKYYELPSIVRSALDSMLQEFRCEKLFDLIDTWPEAHVRAYARIVKLVDKDVISVIQMESQCGSPSRRAKALRLIRFLGKDDRFNQIATDCLADESDEVRIQAIQAIAWGMDREQALELLGPLLQDEHHAVQAAASNCLNDLENTPELEDS